MQELGGRITLTWIVSSCRDTLFVPPFPKGLCVPINFFFRPFFFKEAQDLCIWQPLKGFSTH